jgi:uncharacterized protein YbjT (DUF2867 family)
MKVILFGASGMVGQGVLRQCLIDPDVESVLSVARSPSKLQYQKLREIVHKDFTDFSSIENELTGFDACFYCLGISSAGMTEQDYHRITYDFAMAAAHTLVKLNPRIIFIFVSGAGTDSTEQGRSMWARVKGKTENALLKLPFQRKYMFRPGYIQPMHGAVSKTKIYRAVYIVLGPFYPILKKIFPKYVTNTEQIGRAMLHVVKHGASKTILESSDINQMV